MDGCWSGKVWVCSLSSGIVPVEHGLAHFGAGRAESSRILSCRVSVRLSSVAGGAGNVSFSAVRCR